MSRVVCDTVRKPKSSSPNDRNVIQILSVLIGGLAALSSGILFAWSSPFIVKITQSENYNISEYEASLFPVISPISMLISSIPFSILNDRIGRKLTILLIAVPQILAWICVAVATNVYVFYISRFMTGISDASLFTSFPMYIGEICTPKVRGTWGNAMTFMIYFGQLFICIIGNYVGVRETAYICIVFPVVFLVLFSFMPESPYFYLMKGRDEDAKESLRRLRGRNDIEDDLKILKVDVHRQMSESGTWKDLFRIDSNRRALAAGCFLRISQQLGGTSVFTVYSQFIFEKSGGDISSGTSTIIFMSLCCFLNVCAWFTVDRLGRRLSYILSACLCAVILLCLSAFFYVDQYIPDLDTSFLNWIPVTGMVLFIIFSSFGLGIVPTLLLGELFSTSIKAKGLSGVLLVFGGSFFVTSNLFYLLTSSMGLYGPFLFFGTGNILSMVLAFYMVPETKGKTLEEIQQSLKGKK